MFSGQMDRISVISKDNESIPTFTFKNDCGSVHSLDMKSSLHNVMPEATTESKNTPVVAKTEKLSPVRIGKFSYIIRLVLSHFEVF